MYQLFYPLSMIERHPIEKELTQKTATLPEQEAEVGLRPQTLKDFVGQEHLKDNLHILIEAAKKRTAPLEHILFYGNPGLGKTTLAHIIGNEMNAQVRVTSGPALEKAGDLAAILSNLGRGDVLFIDEIHRLNKLIEEILYPAMEDQVLDIVVGKGPTARTLRLNLEHFTIIGATTRLSLLSAPLRDRFGAIYHLPFYEEEDIAGILQRSADLLQIPLDPASATLLAARARRTPRIANRLLRRVRDFAEVKGNGTIDVATAKAALELFCIDAFGLDRVDRHILETLIETFDGGPAGLQAIAASTQEELATIEDVHEPFLLQIGMLRRTPRGRVVTQKAYTHLGYIPKEPASQ